MIRRTILTIACALALAIPAVRADESRPLRIGLIQQPNSLDPLHAIEYYENFIDVALYSALVDIDDRGQPVPDLAVRVPTRANGDISPDGKTLTYRLRSNVRWQDGVALTSHDVAYTFKRMMDPKTNFVVGSTYGAIARIDTPDDRTVLVRLKVPWADATTQLFVGGQNGSILPQHVLEHIDDLSHSSFESQPMGSGPYRLERWDRGNRIVLRANRDYFRGKPAIDRIDIVFVPDGNTMAIRLRTGEIDFSPQIPSGAALQLRGKPGLAFRAVPTYSTIELDFNTTAPPFDDERVRQALAMAVDRVRIATKADHGLAVPADDLVPPQSPFHVPDPSVRQRGDLETAARVLEAAGWKRRADGLREKKGEMLVAALLIPSGYVATASAAIQIQATWRELGVDASIRPLQVNTLLAPGGALARGDFGVTLGSTGFATSPDRSQYITSGAIPPSGDNFSRVRDRELDRLTFAGRAELDPKKRLALYARISKIVRHRAIVVPLVWADLPYIYDARLTGLRPEPINSDLWNVYDWHFAT